jgi:fructosamine-3-kinase
MISIQEHIEELLGLSSSQMQRVHGGDISDAWCFASGDQRYFLKVNDATRFPGMFAKEARGLQALRMASAISIPEAIACQTVDNRQYLLLQWIERGQPQPDFWESFGSALALQHLQEQAFFGWHEDNYIGSLHQPNTRHASWQAFFTECRVMPLVTRLFERGLMGLKDVAAAERMCHRIDEIFPHEPPALLHGDLWSGNYLIGHDGYAWIFDPSLYCGHRELEIGMTRLFGGFDGRFYKAYHLSYPLAPGWEDRLPIAQLYPLLVHAMLFGGHYISSALAVFKQFRTYGE